MPLLANPAAILYGLERVDMELAAETRPEWKKYLFLEDHNRDSDSPLIEVMTA